MTDRDEFASAALNGILASRTLRGPKQLPQDVVEAFEYADAMIAEREKRRIAARAEKQIGEGRPPG